MKLFRKLILIILPLIFLFSLFQIVRAQNEFTVDTNVTYAVQESGKTIVTHNVVLENNFSDLYATSYSLGLDNIEATNITSFGSDGTQYTTDVSKDGTETDIKVTFPDASIGKGTKRNFTISYENSSFAVRTGEVWEVSIPRVGDQTNFRSYNLTLKVPKSFGLEAYISPKPQTTDNNEEGYVYTFSKSDLTQTGITAGYGQFQVFNFNLSYHLENPVARTSTTDIALPPDTAFQKVYIQSIDPKPTNVTIDEDGNWLATYTLSSRQRVDVKVAGFVQIFASYRSFPTPSNQAINDNLKDSQYWQVGDAAIRDLAAKLKTPQAIYNYVATTLKYDISRVQPNVQRLGALEALKNPSAAICMEYTDLFIAIARAAGIPAREVEGFAYTENPDLQPLGLVADVLHAWPEYYDEKKGVWIPIDPTWGSTTGGEDFFNKLDLRHFAFVLHGANPTTPYPPGSYKLGTNPQKDIYVSFGTLPEGRITTPEINISPYRTLPFLSSIYQAGVYNPGPAALYDVYPTIYYDSTEKTRDFIEVLPPYSTYRIQITLPYGLLGKDMPNVLKVAIGQTEAQTLTNKKDIVVESLAAVLVFIVIITTIIFVKVRKIKIIKFFAKIQKRFIKHDKRHTTKSEEDKSNPKGI